MAKHLNDKVGSMEYDKLIAGITPPVKVASGIITKLSAAATYPRGTVLCRSSGTGGDGKLKILGTTAVEIKRETLSSTDAIIGGNDNLITSCKRNLLVVFKLACTDLRTLGIQKNCYWNTKLLRNTTNSLDASTMILMASMREVKTSDIHARLNELPQDILIFSCWTHGAYDFCLLESHESSFLRLTGPLYLIDSLRRTM